MVTSLTLMLIAQAAKKPAEVPFKDIAAPIEVPFRTTDSAMIVDALVNGKNLSFMFDTGFSGWVTCDAGINLGKPDGKINLQDFVGVFAADTVSIKTLKLGAMDIPVKGTDAAAVMQPGEDHTMSYGMHCDGLMGFSVISHVTAEINFEKKKFIFYPKSYDITKKVADGKKTFLAKMLPTGVNSMELSVKLDQGGSMTLALDTGNGFYATTHKEVLDRLGVWPITKKPTFSSRAFVASGPVETFNFQMPNCKIFGVPVEKSVWSIIDLPPSAADQDGTVGYQFLKNFNITFDMERRRVFLENWTGRVTDAPDGEAGLAAFWDTAKKRYIVAFVQPGGPASKAGVKEGDALLAVNGEELVNIGFDRLRRKLEGPVDTSVKLALSRKGDLYRVELKRIEMVNLPAPK
jgi:predicted aspartyl protease